MDNPYSGVGWDRPGVGICPGNADAKEEEIEWPT